MKYPGKELEVFDKAIVFQKYTYFIIKKLPYGLTSNAGLPFVGQYFKHVGVSARVDRQFPLWVGPIVFLIPPYQQTRYSKNRRSFLPQTHKGRGSQVNQKKRRTCY